VRALHAAEGDEVRMAHQESIFEGKTLDDAVRKGLDALGLSRAEVMITVMEEGSSGFLGLGSRPYRVRVMPRPGGPPREPGERASGRGSRRERGGRDDRRRDGRGGRAENGRRGGEGGRDGGRDGGRGRRDRREPARAGDGRREGGRGAHGGPPQEARAHEPRTHEPRTHEPRAHEPRAHEPRGQAPQGDDHAQMRGEPRGGEGHDRDGGSRRRRRGRRGRGRGDAGVRPRPEEMGEAMGSSGDTGMVPTHERAVPPADLDRTEPLEAANREAMPPREAREPREMREREPREMRGPREERGGRRDDGRSRDEGPVMAADELEARARQITEDLLAAMGFPAKITSRSEGTDVDVIAEVSEDEDLLTGRKGEIRQALQHLLNLSLNRGGGMRYHLQLEINEFWRHRETELRDQARAMADEAVANGREVVTEYLNAQERRVIHVTLRDDDRVKTYAIGDGLIKKLAVAPAGQPEAARAED
jgi:spoIIIJ-associated protein